MKRSPRILQLGTYPIARAVNGGQRRVRAVRDAYQAHGIAVRYLGIYFPAWHGLEELPRDDLAVGKAIEERLKQRPSLEDVILGEVLAEDRDCRERFLNAWRHWQPDVLELAQPYVWPSIRRFLEQKAITRPRIVYHSQNIESLLKADLYAQHLPAGEREAATEKVRTLEADLTRAADLVVAVTDHDAAHFTQLGCPACLVVRNGGEVRKAARSRIKDWRRQLAASGKERFAIFVSSGHLPNLEGFLQVVGTRLGYLPPDTELLVAGSICGLVREALLNGQFAGVNASRLRLLGILPDGDLAAVLALANVVLLPITAGGGSNLKTVEALLAQRPMVATRFAFRSYERYLPYGQVRLHDEPAAFREAVVEQLAEEPRTSRPLPPELLELTWPRLCEPLAEAVLRLAG